MNTTRRAFFRNGVAWLATFLGAYVFAKAFGELYRRDDRAGETSHSKAKFKRKALRSRPTLKGDGLVLNRRSGVVHWPKLFKHRYTISKKNAVSILGPALASAILKIRTTYAQKAGPEVAQLVHRLSKMPPTYAKTDYPAVSALFSELQRKYGVRDPAEILCSTAGLHSSGRTTAERNSTDPRSPVEALTCRFTSNRRSIVVEHLALASIEVHQRSQGSERELALQFDNIGVALQLLMLVLPYEPQIGSDEQETTREVEVESNLAKSLSPRDAWRRKQLRNYSLYAKLISLHYENEPGQAYRAVAVALRRPHAEMRRVEPGKW